LVCFYWLSATAWSKYLKNKLLWVLKEVDADAPFDLWKYIHETFKEIRNENKK
jgi:hypothetical protein